MLIQNKAANSANVAKYSATNQLKSYRTIEKKYFQCYSQSYVSRYTQNIFRNYYFYMISVPY